MLDSNMQLEQLHLQNLAGHIEADLPLPAETFEWMINQYKQVIYNGATPAEAFPGRKHAADYWRSKRNLLLNAIYQQVTHRYPALPKYKRCEIIQDMLLEPSQFDSDDLLLSLIDQLNLTLLFIAHAELTPDYISRIINDT